MPPLLAEWRDRCAQEAGGTQTLEQVSVNWYPPKSKIGEHIDDTVFGEPILVLSLVSAAQVQWKEKETGELITKTIEPRSLYIMAGDVRYLWFHRVLPTPAERYAVIFRPLSKAQKLSE
jgi:alkylated DNA repair dioxygenase AlkB